MLTATIAQPRDAVRARYAEAVCDLRGINGLTYDVTSNLPGTIEWE
jgi:GMP synthase PP-ATPase subunit